MGANPAEGEKRVPAKDPPSMKRLMQGYDAWIDPTHKRIVVDGTVCLREGALEMFACTRGTKEHESIVAADTMAYAVHAGLLALGAKSGTPVQFQPTYMPATGTELKVGDVLTPSTGGVCTIASITSATVLDCTVAPSPVWSGPATFTAVRANSALFPTYIASIPTDPAGGTPCAVGSGCTTEGALALGATNSGYYLARTTGNRIEIGACKPEQASSISVKR